MHISKYMCVCQNMCVCVSCAFGQVTVASHSHNPRHSRHVWKYVRYPYINHWIKQTFEAIWSLWNCSLKYMIFVNLNVHIKYINNILYYIYINLYKSYIFNMIYHVQHKRPRLPNYKVPFKSSLPTTPKTGKWFSNDPCGCFGNQ